MKNWYTETIHEGMQFSLSRDKKMYADEHIEVFENQRFGRVLSIDNAVQLTEADEFIYHEMLAHVPMFSHGHVQNVLIIGGGDGGMARRVLMHRDIQVTQVEISKDIIEVAKTYLPRVCGSVYDDKRLELVITDGKDYVEKTEKKFDVIIADLPDPIGPVAALFEEAFYRDCKKCLRSNGILVTQNGVPFLQGEELVTSVKAFRKHFTVGTCYTATVPTYSGGLMAFGLATDNEAHANPSVPVLQERFQKAGITTEYYTPEVHAASFVLPKYLEMLITEQ